MTTYADVRDGLEDALSAIAGVVIYRTPPEDISAPAVMIGGIDRTGREAISDQTVLVTLTALVSKRHTDQFDTLDMMCDLTGSLSIQAAVEADPDLGSRVDSVRVVSVSDQRELVIGETGYYAADVVVEVLY